MSKCFSSYLSAHSTFIMMTSVSAKATGSVAVRVVSVFGCTFICVASFDTHCVQVQFILQLTVILYNNYADPPLLFPVLMFVGAPRQC